MGKPEHDSKEIGCLMMRNKKILMGLLIIVLIGIVLLIYQKNSIQQYNILSDEDIANQIKENQGVSCFYTQDAYPRVLGVHSKNNLILIETCGCSDYCPPELWTSDIIYQNISSEEECIQIDGKVLIDFAWGMQYRACAPNIE